MWAKNKQLILINALDEYINNAEGDLDYIKFRIIEFLQKKEFNQNTFSLKQEDIIEFLKWYNIQEQYHIKVSPSRCKEVINFIFDIKKMD